MNWGPFEVSFNFFPLKNQRKTSKRKKIILWTENKFETNPLILKPVMRVLGKSKARMSGPLEVSGDKRTN